MQTPTPVPTPTPAPTPTPTVGAVYDCTIKFARSQTVPIAPIARSSDLIRAVIDRACRGSGHGAFNGACSGACVAPIAPIGLDQARQDLPDSAGGFQPGPESFGFRWGLSAGAGILRIPLGAFSRGRNPSDSAGGFQPGPESFGFRWGAFSRGRNPSDSAGGLSAGAGILRIPLGGLANTRFQRCPATGEPARSPRES